MATVVSTLATTKPAAPAAKPFVVPPATFAGFTPQNIAEYFGVNTTQAAGIIALANGAKITALAQAERDALAKINPIRFKPGATTYNQGFGDITWGLNHLAEHPAGSHYHGDFNVTDLVANIATGGLYGVAKAGFNVVTGGKILPNLATVQALTLPGGSALQPTVGTKNTLLIEAAVASIGLPSVAPTLATLLAAGGGIGAALLNKAKSSIINFVAGDTGAPTGDSRGVSPGSPIYPSTGIPTYLVTGASSPGGATFITDGSSVPSGPVPASPNTIAFSPALLPIVVLGSLAFFFLLRRSRP